MATIVSNASMGWRYVAYENGAQCVWFRIEPMASGRDIVYVPSNATWRNPRRIGPRGRYREILAHLKRDSLESQATLEGFRRPYRDLDGSGRDSRFAGIRHKAENFWKTNAFFIRTENRHTNRRMKSGTNCASNSRKPVRAR